MTDENTRASQLGKLLDTKGPDSGDTAYLRSVADELGANGTDEGSAHSHNLQAIADKIDRASLQPSVAEAELENIVINLVGAFKAHCENADEFLEPDDQANFDHWEAEAFRILTALRTDRKAVLVEELLVLIETAHEHGDECAIVEKAQAIRALAEGAGK